MNLIAFSGFPQGARKAQLDFMAEDSAGLKKAARAAGLTLGPKKTGFLVQGEDHLGAAAAIARKLSAVGINLASMQTVCAGAGRYGGLFWVKPEDVRKAAKARWKRNSTGRRGSLAAAGGQWDPGRVRRLVVVPAPVKHENVFYRV